MIPVNRVVPALRKVSEGGEGANVVILGANVARQCLEAGLVDEIIVHIAPVLVGGGVRLYESDGGASIRLKAISSHMEGETTVLRYAVHQRPGERR